MGWTITLDEFRELVEDCGNVASAIVTASRRGEGRSLVQLLDRLSFEELIETVGQTGLDNELKWQILARALKLAVTHKQCRQVNWEIVGASIPGKLGRGRKLRRQVLDKALKLATTSKQCIWVWVQVYGRGRYNSIEQLALVKALGLATILEEYINIRKRVDGRSRLGRQAKAEFGKILQETYARIFPEAA